MHPKRKLDTTTADAIFDALGNPRRRMILLYVDLHGAASLSGATEFVAASENDKPPAQLDAQERKRVYIALYQSHIPKLDAAGLVRSERDGHLLYPTDLTREAASFVREGRERFGGVSLKYAHDAHREHPADDEAIPAGSD